MKQTSSRIIPLVLFIILSVMDIWAVDTSNNQIITLVKPFLMLTLMWYYLINTITRNRIYVLALLFSFLGDVFLLNKESLFFLSGLISFLIAHFFYIFMVRNLLTKPNKHQLILSVLPNLIILLVLLSLLFPSLGEMKIPVIIYGVTITTFGTVSLLYFFQKRNQLALLLMTGAYMFILSDSLLAINMFYSPISVFPVLIMITYLVAQFLICKFVLKLERS